MAVLDAIRAAYGISQGALARASQRSVWAVSRSMRKPLRKITLGEIQDLCAVIQKAPVDVLPCLAQIPPRHEASSPRAS